MHIHHFFTTTSKKRIKDKNVAISRTNKVCVATQVSSSSEVIQVSSSSAATQASSSSKKTESSSSAATQASSSSAATQVSSSSKKTETSSSSKDKNTIISLNPRDLRVTWNSKQQAILLYSSHSSNAKIHIFDAQGVRIVNQNKFILQGITSIPLAPFNLANGKYVLLVEADRIHTKNIITINNAGK